MCEPCHIEIDKAASPETGKIALDLCKHLSQPKCDTNKCSIHQKSPWPCYDTFHGVFDSENTNIIQPNLNVRLTCPRGKSQAQARISLSAEEYEKKLQEGNYRCAVHDLVEAVGIKPGDLVWYLSGFNLRTYGVVKSIAIHGSTKKVWAHWAHSIEGAREEKTGLIWVERPAMLCFNGAQ